ncbi:MAG: hypothetical protein K9J30_12920 [Bacteroidales bacterium]|nr:hypothetical protein [Bacteroidales bacterium]
MKKTLAVIALVAFLGGMSAPVLANESVVIESVTDKDPKKAKKTEKSEKSEKSEKKASECTTEKKASECTTEKKSSDCTAKKESTCDSKK